MSPEKNRSQNIDFANIDKTIPQSIEAEQIVLGSILYDQNSINEISYQLKPDYFYLEKHAQIYECMIALSSKYEEIGLISVLEKMKEYGYFKEGDREYIYSLEANYSPVNNVNFYVNIIVEKKSAREMIKICQDVSEMCYNNQPFEDIVDKAEGMISKVKGNRSYNSLLQINEVVEETMKTLQAKQNDTDGQFESVKSGIESIDSFTGGFGKGDLIVLAARPGIGKTALALNMAYNIASSTRYKPSKSVVVFSLEMSVEQLAQRIISSNLLINSESLRDGTLTEDEWKELYYFYDDVLPRVKLYCDQTTNVTINDIKSKARKLPNLGLIVIDYLQLMTSSKPSDNRVAEITELTRSIKLMARELNVPVLLLSQLSRNIDQRKGVREPKLSDLRDSGSIEQDADVVFFIDNIEGSESDPVKNNMKNFYVQKNRRGRLGMIKLAWDGEHTTFRAIDNH